MRLKAVEMNRLGMSNEGIAAELGVLMVTRSPSWCK
jgi:hypothetical protein